MNKKEIAINKTEWVQRQRGESDFFLREREREVYKNLKGKDMTSLVGKKLVKCDCRSGDGGFCIVKKRWFMGKVDYGFMRERERERVGKGVGVCVL